MESNQLRTNYRRQRASFFFRRIIINPFNMVHTIVTPAWTAHRATGSDEIVPVNTTVPTRICDLRFVRLDCISSMLYSFRVSATRACGFGLVISWSFFCWWSIGVRIGSCRLLIHRLTQTWLWSFAFVNVELLAPHQVCPPENENASRPRQRPSSAKGVPASSPSSLDI